LAADDVRPLVIHVVPPPTYALVTRQSTDQRPSSSFYLERALAPTEARQGHGTSRVVRVDPDRIDRETLAGADLVVFDHPGRLSPDAINLLAAALRRGRPILYVAAESPDATNLKLLADACGSDLKMPVQFMPPAAGQLRHDLFLQEVNAKVPPFSVFGDGVPLIKSKTKFSGGLVSRRLPGGLGDDVLASFSDRTAALIVTPCGAGTLAVLNVDLESSTLPGSPAFVPLIGELVDRLSGQGAATATITSGDLVAIDLPPEAGTALGLKIVGPSSAASADFGQIVTEGAGAAWGWPIAGPPGVYQIKRNDATVFAAACVLPPDEADLTHLDPELIRTRLAAGRQLHFRSAQQEEESKDTHWTWLAVACAGCMLVELVALKMYRT
jgi:hypothetical protein